MRVILGDSSVHASSSLSFSVLALCPLRLVLAPGGVRRYEVVAVSYL